MLNLPKKVFYCLVCGAKFKRKSTMINHCKKHETDSKIEYLFRTFTNPERYEGKLKSRFITSITDKGFNYNGGFLSENPFTLLP